MSWSRGSNLEVLFGGKYANFYGFQTWWNCKLFSYPPTIKPFDVLRFFLHQMQQTTHKTDFVSSMIWDYFGTWPRKWWHLNSIKHCGFCDFSMIKDFHLSLLSILILSRTVIAYCLLAFPSLNFLLLIFIVLDGNNWLNSQTSSTL